MKYLIFRAWVRMRSRWLSSMILIFQLTVAFVLLQLFMNMYFSIQGAQAEREQKFSLETFQVLPINAEPHPGLHEGYDGGIFAAVASRVGEDAIAAGYMTAPRILVTEHAARSVYFLFVTEQYAEAFPDEMERLGIEQFQDGKAYISSELAELLDHSTLAGEEDVFTFTDGSLTYKQASIPVEIVQPNEETTLIDDGYYLKKQVELKDIVLVPYHYFAELFSQRAVDHPHLALASTEGGDLLNGFHAALQYLNQELDNPYRYTIESSLGKFLQETESQKNLAIIMLGVTLFILLINAVCYFGLQLQYIRARLKEFAACLSFGASARQMGTELAIETGMKVFPALCLSWLIAISIGSQIDPMSFSYQEHTMTYIIAFLAALKLIVLLVVPMLLHLRSAILSRYLLEVRG